MSKILLLEPDSMLGQTYQTALEYKGYSVDWCQDAQTAIQSVDSGLPDLIITELQLALHNGIEFLYELRSYNEWQTIPIMILSNVPALERTLLRVLWQHIRITTYHYKPLTKLHEFLASVEEVLAPVA